MEYTTWLFTCLVTLWQEDCKRRVETYQDLKSHGAHALDEKAIASARDCFERNSSGALVPRPYASYGQPHNSVRYIAVALDGEEGGRDLRDAVAHVTAQVMGDLGENMEAYLNPPDTLHLSVFHTGRPERPEWWRPLSSFETKEEKSKMTHLVESTGFSKGTFQVVVEDVVLASSGILLLLMSSPNGLPAPVDELRAKCRETFTNNANFKQATYVLHTSFACIV